MLKACPLRREGFCSGQGAVCLCLYFTQPRCRLIVGAAKEGLKAEKHRLHLLGRARKFTNDTFGIG